jgi:DNA-binding response OmpR family regulator
MTITASVENRTSEQGLARVLLLEPNAPLRNAILAVLAAEAYHVEACESLEQVLVRSNDRNGGTHDVALVAWQAMGGLLAEEHRHRLAELTDQLRVVLMVPRRWARLLDRTDLGAYVAGLVAKPFEADELLRTLQRALA